MVQLPGAAFMALLVLIGAGSTVHVIPDPQNVALTCVNQVPVVRWDYSPQQPQTSFSVYIKGSAGNHEYKTTDHEYDLRHFVWKSEDRYMAYHIVTVTALMGGNQSKPVSTKSFSFNKLKIPDIECQLDFPPVNLTVDGSEATVSVLNPFSFYPELKWANKSPSASFWFQISVRNNTREFRCKADQRLCRYVFEFPVDVEPCIKLRGWLVEGNEVGRVGFREKDQVCHSSTMGLDWGVVVLMLVVFVVPVIGIIFIVRKTGACALKTGPPPRSLDFTEFSRDQDRHSAEDSVSDISPVQVDKDKVKDVDVHVDSEEEEDVCSTAALLDGGSSPGPQDPTRDSYMERRFSDSSSSSSREGTGLMSVETGRVSMNSTEEEQESPYDHPHKLWIDMGDGDTVMAYNTS